MISVRLKSGKYIRLEDGVRKTYLKGSFVEFESVFNIPDGFRSSFEIPAHQTEEAIEEEPEGPPELKFKTEHRGGGRYNVVNIETGEKINDEFLAKEDALALVDSVTAEVEEPSVDGYEEQP